MDTPTFVVLWLLTVVGLYEVLFAAVSFLFLAPVSKNCGIIELRGHMDNTEFLIRSALLRNSGNIYIIDCGADFETLRIAQLLAQNNSRLTILRSDDTVIMLSENAVD